MPEKRTLERAERDRRQGKAASTQAGEFIREEMEHIRAGKHGARSTKQAIAIGLSKARRAGVELSPPRNASAPRKTRQRATRDYAVGHGAPTRRRMSKTSRSRVSLQTVKREGTNAADHAALASQAKSAARRRTAAQRSDAAQKAVETKSASGRSAAARKAAATRHQRQRHGHTSHA